MNKLSEIARSVRTYTQKHSSEILTGVGIAGMLTTTVLAVMVTPKALVLLEEEKRRQDRVFLEEAKRNNRAECAKVDKLKALEVVKTTWKCYIPPVVTGGVSIACLIGASSVNIRRNAALATAYSLSESALREYREKVIETIGENKEQGIRDAVAKDTVTNNPVDRHEVFITDKGDTLCLDVASKRYFRTDIDRLKRAENDLNKQMRDDMYVSLNDFYFEIGLEPTSVGDDLGWNIDNGYIDLHFSSQLTPKGEPCLVIDYVVGPRYDYRNLH